MYVGRIVAAGINRDGEPVALYRISSRSFTDRTIIVSDSRAEVATKTPGVQHNSSFIYYGCYRATGKHAVVGNGTHTDWIADKVAWGSNPRDALVDTLRFMDYEHDSLSTPRIAAVVCPEVNKVYFGSVAPSDILVWQLSIVPGQIHCIATYESMHRPEGSRSGTLCGVSPSELAKEICNGGLFAQFERPICGFASVFQNGAWSKGTIHESVPEAKN